MQTKSSTERQRGGGNREREIEERQSQHPHKLLSNEVAEGSQADTLVLHTLSQGSQTGVQTCWFHSKLKQNYACVWYRFPFILLFGDKNF